MGYPTIFSPLKALCLFVLVVGCNSAAPHNDVCPFDYMFHAGDGFFDVGNALLRPGGSRLPANNLPYGITDPGYPTGRWSNGIMDIDMGGTVMGFPNPTPSLIANTTDSSIIFATARSPVLDRSFFTERNITIPVFVAPLSTQMQWYRDHVNTLCSTPAECTAVVENSVFMFGDVEANDLGYALIQGKTVEEVRSYAPIVTNAQISYAREVIAMGTTRLVFPGSAPLGCFPYILTKLASDNPLDYDERGCLWKVNDIIKYKNELLQSAVNALVAEYPTYIIVMADIYGTFETVLDESLSDPKNVSLQACCGTGGKYNFDSKRFCGTKGVKACADPSRYLHWDGVHLTQNGQYLISTILQAGVVPTFNCTTSLTLSRSSKHTILEQVTDIA